MPEREYLTLGVSPEVMQKLRERADKNYLPVAVYAASMLSKATLKGERQNGQ